MSRRRARRGRGPRILLALAVVVVVLLVGAGGTALYARSQLDAPASRHTTGVAIDVASGETLDGLVTELQSHDLVRDPFWFRWYARLRGLGSQLKAGRYHLDTGMGASAVVARLEMPPDARTVRVVIPEGLIAAQIAERVQATGLGVSAAAYLGEERTGQFTAGFIEGRPAGTPLEGMLFPDTYDVPVGASAHDVVAQQLEAFTAKALPMVGAAPQGLTPYQVVVLASIVEREARLPADRPMVAGVLYNRLARGMDLQVDASVIYGVGVTDRAPTSDELKHDTPYNTYLHRGLPPTPISNPGLASLEAAAHPMPSNYLFYVSDGCGHNHYSSTLAGHNALVQQYLNSPCR
ncbi:MAG TPA: endolytic transglycosylase MltG [Candidatus Dormibacteraeota bacterium]